jgi:hypothetical protein
MARYDDDVVVDRDVNRDVHVNRAVAPLSDGFARMLAGLALVLSLLALMLAWQAYDRTGVDLDERIKNAASSAANKVEAGADATGDAIKDGAADAERAIDAGPDGVDNDDTDVRR